MSVPLLVINLTPAEWAADFQGEYSATGHYVPQQIVRHGAEAFWRCLAATVGHTPEEGSPYWQFIGNVEAVVTLAAVEEAASEAVRGMLLKNSQ